MIKLIHGDCLEKMDELISEGIKVDMILTDPPYGSTSCKWDIIIPFNKMWDKINKIIKDNGAIVLFGNEPFSSYLRLSNVKNYKYDWIWYKNSSGGFVMAKKQPMRHHENILVFYKKQCNYYPIMEEYAESTKRRFKNGEMVNRNKMPKSEIYDGLSYKGKKPIDFKVGRYPKTILQFKSVHNHKRFHPSQKPVKLLEYLIKTYTLENETVLDFTMGSGSTGIACKNLNRNFIGIELDDKYFKIAKNRIEKHQVQKEMF